MALELNAQFISYTRLKVTICYLHVLYDLVSSLSKKLMENS